MKNITLVVINIILLFVSCEAERLNNVETLETFELNSTKQTSLVNTSTIFQECLVSDKQNCRSTNGEITTSNLWWPENISDLLDTSQLFSSSDRNTLLFTEYNNGTARLMGTTKMESCILRVEIWFKNQMEPKLWFKMGGALLQEKCHSEDPSPKTYKFYVIDSSKSTISSLDGNCGFRGLDSYGVVQSKEASTPTHYGSQISYKNSDNNYKFPRKSLKSRAWITNKITGEILWPLELDFDLECTVQTDEGCQEVFSYHQDIGSCFPSVGNSSQGGWTLGPLKEGDYSFDLYTNNTKCDIKNAKSVGRVAVSYEDGKVLVTYNIDKEYELMERNTYAGQNNFPANKKGETTLVPGQYNITENLNGDIYIIAHAVVCLK